MARSRFVRDPSVSLLLTARDDAMLRLLLRVRYARVEHFQQLFFSSYKTAAERCSKLFHTGFFDRTPLPARRGQAATIHSIATSGINRLREIGVAVPREWRTKATSPTILDHELAVTDVLVSFLSGETGRGVDEPVYERASKHLVVKLPDDVVAGSIKPDGALVVDDAHERLFALIEVDRATMSPVVMREKFSAYRDAAMDGDCIEATLTALLSRHNVPLVEHQASVKLLVTVPSMKRAVQLADIAVGLGLKNFVMVAVHEDLVKAGVFAPVWKSAQMWVDDAEQAGVRLVG